MTEQADPIVYACGPDGKSGRGSPSQDLKPVLRNEAEPFERRAFYHLQIVLDRPYEFANRPAKDYLSGMEKCASAATDDSTSHADAVAGHALAGGFKTIANALKPMSRQGSISMAQARKAVQDYVRASSK